MALVAGEFEGPAAAKAITLSAGPLAEGVSVEGDPERFRMLLENLIDDALKYTPDSGEARISLQANRRVARRRDRLGSRPVGEIAWESRTGGGSRFFVHPPVIQ